MKSYKNMLAVAFFLLFPCVSQAAQTCDDLRKEYKNVGLNLTDWSAFDKTVCGIVLKDKDGNILFGREPSVAECESYNGPNLLQPLYSRKE